MAYKEKVKHHFRQLRDSLSFYDALCLALAERLDCPLITADGRIGLAHPQHDLIRTIPSG